MAAERHRVQPPQARWVMRDRAMQALYLLALEPIAETTAEPNSYGFRTSCSTADAIEQCFTVLARGDRAQWVLEGNITSCFDRISHDWLLTHIPMERAILQKWLKAGFMERHTFHPTEEGTPHGGVISPVLANLTLDGLERILREQYPKSFRQGRPEAGKPRTVRGRLRAPRGAYGHGARAPTAGRRAVSLSP